MEGITIGAEFEVWRPLCSIHGLHWICTAQRIIPGNILTSFAIIYLSDSLRRELGWCHHWLGLQPADRLWWIDSLVKRASWFTQGRVGSGLDDLLLRRMHNYILGGHLARISWAISLDTVFLTFGYERDLRDDRGKSLVVLPKRNKNKRYNDIQCINRITNTYLWWDLFALAQHLKSFMYTNSITELLIQLFASFVDRYCIQYLHVFRAGFMVLLIYLLVHINMWLFSDIFCLKMLRFISVNNYRNTPKIY